MDCYFEVPADELVRIKKIRSLLLKITKNLGQRKLMLLHELTNELQGYHLESCSRETALLLVFNGMKEILENECEKLDNN